MAQINSASDIGNIAIIGAGRLGTRVATRFALSGFKVAIFDISDQSLTICRRHVDKLFSNFVADGKITRREAEESLGSLVLTRDLEKACYDVDLVNESVTEDLETKRSIWSKLDSCCPDRTVYTTNTSSILPSLLSPSVASPEKFCAFHFQDGLEVRFVDIMPHPGTADWVVELLGELAGRLEHIPMVIAREWPGYVNNHVTIAWLKAACELVVQGAAKPHDIDRMWTMSSQGSLGPFAVMDKVGLDTMANIFDGLEDELAKRIAKFLAEDYVRPGATGQRSGQGFYRYPNPEYSSW